MKSMIILRAAPVFFGALTLLAPLHAAARDLVQPPIADRVAPASPPNGGSG